MQSTAFGTQKNLGPVTRLIKHGLRIMKLVSLLLIIVLQTAARPTASAQVTLKEASAPLEKVLKAIKKQSNYDLFFDEILIKKKGKPVQINVNNVPVEEALAQVFKAQDQLTYSLNGKIISVKEKIVAPITQGLNPGLIVPPPPLDVKGRVVNEKGEPLAGVSVLIKGTRRGTSTDENGVFELKGLNEDAVLQFSGVNIEAYETPLKGRTEFNFTAKAKISTLQDVEITSVNTGYQTIPKERATGSFSTVSKKQLDQRVSTDIISRLQGITSGLTFFVGSNGERKLSIRGRSTIQSNDAPLIVVDNFPYDGDINNINPNDVENVTVLKDAAAAAIWGIRAGNGVIVITTRKGQKNQPLKVDFSSNISISVKPDLTYNPNFLDASSFIDVEKTLYNQGFYTSTLNDPNTPISQVVQILSTNTPSQAESKVAAFRTLDIRDQISKYFYQNAVNHQYALNLSGGSDKISYYISGGFDNSLQNLVGNSYQRATITSTTAFYPFKKMEIKVGFNYINAQNKSDNTLSQLQSGGAKGLGLLPYTQLTGTDGEPMPFLKGYNSSFTSNAMSKGFLDWSFTPLVELRNHYNTSLSSNSEIRPNLTLRYDLFNGLNIEGFYQYQKNLTFSEINWDSKSYYARDLVNSLSKVSSGNFSSYVIPPGGIKNLNNSNAVSNSFRGQLTYGRSTENQDFQIIGGIEQREITTYGYGNVLYGFDQNTGTSVAVDNVTSFVTYPRGSSQFIPSSLGTISTTDRFISYFSNASYSYLNRYTLSLSGRADGANFFGSDVNQKFIPLWSIGSKWDISKEAFYKIAWLPKLNLRLTYGYNGNFNRRLAALTTISLFSGNPTSGQVNNAPNADLRMEKTGFFNFGLDFSLFKGVVNGSIDVFHKNGENLIGEKSIDPTLGYTSNGRYTVFGNYAKMLGNGIDIQINTNILNGQFKWRANFLFSYAADKVTSYTATITPTTYVQFSTTGVANGFLVPMEGKPVYAIYAYKWAGLDPLTGEPRGYLNGDISKDYTRLTNPVSKDDIAYIGPANPVYSGGLTNNFTYKNWTIAFNFSYKFGYYFKRSSINYAGLFNSWSGHKDFYNRWQKAGDENLTYIPAMPSNASYVWQNFYNNSSVLIEKGDHIRLQDFYLSYALNQQILRSSPFKSLQLFAIINNVGIVWRSNKQGLDPDVINGNYPLARTISFGIKAGL